MTSHLILNLRQAGDNTVQETVDTISSLSSIREPVLATSRFLGNSEASHRDEDEDGEDIDEWTVVEAEI
jgi:hypothetical protein